METMMINIKTLSAISMISLMAPWPALAADVPASAVAGKPMASPQDRQDDSSVFRTIKVFFAGLNENQSFEPILIRQDMTAHGLIGESVMDASNKKIAVVNDIILDKSGVPILVILSDKGFLGIGNKLAAFDYKNVIRQNQDGDVTMSLTQGMIDRAADFSYDRKDWAKAKVIPTDSMSVNVLLRGSLYDHTDKVLATIENVYFRSGDPSQVIVGFNKVMGMGGDLATLDFKNLQVMKKDGQVDFKLSAPQTELFKKFQKSVMN
jgi:uncharacterized protein YrrD